MASSNMPGMIVPDMTGPQSPPPPSINLHSPSGGPNNFFKDNWGKLLLLVLVVILLAGLIFGFVVIGLGKTALGKSMQDDLWTKLIESEGSSVAEFDMSITYTDVGSFNFLPSDFIKAIYPDDLTEMMDEIDKTFGLDINNLNIDANTTSYINATTPSKAQLDSRIFGSFTNKQTSYDATAEVKLTENTLFTKYALGEQTIAKLREMNSGEDFTKNNKWIRHEDEFAIKDWNELLDTLLLRKAGEETSSNDEQKQIAKAHRLFAIKNISGVSWKDGQPILSYDVRLDKVQLRQAIIETIKTEAKEDYDSELQQLTEAFTDAILEKINEDGYSLSIGASDKKIYGAKMVINAISASKAGQYFLTEIRNQKSDLRKFIDNQLGTPTPMVVQNSSTSNDQKRVADMRQLASALELYFNDHNSYPPAQNGKPIGLEGVYVAQLPVAPEPPDGTCDAYHNEYWYTTPEPTTNPDNPQAPKFGSYKYSFCLGQDTGGVAGGNNEISELGVLHTAEISAPPVEAPSEPATSHDQEFQATKNLIAKTIKELSFDAKIEINFTAHSYQQTKTIEEPTGAVTEEELYNQAK